MNQIIKISDQYFRPEICKIIILNLSESNEVFTNTKIKKIHL